MHTNEVSDSYQPWIHIVEALARVIVDELQTPGTGYYCVCVCVCVCVYDANR